jgi:hypothetical protein
MISKLKDSDTFLLNSLAAFDASKYGWLPCVQVGVPLFVKDLIARKYVRRVEKNCFITEAGRKERERLRALALAAEKRKGRKA